MFGATEKVTPEYPNTFGWQVRQLGEEHVQYSMQAGWTVVRQGTPMVFGRLMFDMLSWEKRMDGDNTLSAFSPTLDFGVAPWGKGLCVSASTTYDVHFDAPDRWIAGVFVGVCAGRLK
jgi:hypothetical protein